MVSSKYMYCIASCTNAGTYAGCAQFFKLTWCWLLRSWRRLGCRLRSWLRRGCRIRRGIQQSGGSSSSNIRVGEVGEGLSLCMVCSVRLILKERGAAAKQTAADSGLCDFSTTIQYYTTLHYTTLHYTTLHYTILHYITLHYTTHYTTG
jgi:hypothetical protein